MIVDVIERLKIDGIIATNTTVSRDNLAHRREARVPRVEKADSAASL